MSYHLTFSQLMAIYIIIGALIYFLSDMRSSLAAVINFVLGIIYLLFAFNLIKFGFDPKWILIGTISVLTVFSFFHMLWVKEKKLKILAAGLQFIAALTALLSYLNVIR